MTLTLNIDAEGSSPLVARPYCTDLHAEYVEGEPYPVADGTAADYAALRAATDLADEAEAF